MQNLKTPIRRLAVLLLLIASLFCSTLVTAQTAVQPQGAGTVASPYLISNWQELYWISQTSTSWNKQFLQTADIDLALAVPSINTWSSNTGFTPIGNYSTSFSGSYDGSGHVINGLYINRPSSDYQALFGKIYNGVIKNLGVTDAYVSGSQDVGSLAGFHYGTISNCFSSGRVEGTDYVGGFVGSMSYGQISNSFSRTDVVRTSGTETSFGGFVWRTYQGKITNCYSTGKVIYLTGSSPIDKGFIGEVITGGSFSMLGNFWDTETSGQSTGIYATGASTAEMHTQETFTDWDFTSTWAINQNINFGYPYINLPGFVKQLSKPTILTGIASRTVTSISAKVNLAFSGASPIQMVGILIDSRPYPTLGISRQLDVNIQAVLAGETLVEIDNLTENTVYYLRAFASTSVETTYSDQVITFTLKEIAGSPSGTGEESDPYIISNLQHLSWIAAQVNQNKIDFNGKYFRQINSIDASETKLWNSGKGWEPIGCASVGNIMCDLPQFNGHYDGAGFAISNLNINRPLYHDKIEPNSGTLGLFGAIGADGSVKKLILNDVSIVVGKNGGRAISAPYIGVLAGVNNGEVESVSVSGSVSISGLLGGLVSLNSGTIRQCLSDLNINELNFYTFNKRSTGGFVRENFGAIYSSISRCSVNSSDGSGFVEGNFGTIKDCYADADGFYAGFVNSNTGQILNSYSLGKANYGFGSASAACFWDTETSGTNYGGSGVVGKTTAEMKSANTFIDAGWDFKGETTNGTENIWVIHPSYNNGYPFLAWEAPQMTYLGGSVYYDRDKSNAFSQGDVALGGIKVELLPEGTITGTARDGSYLFYTAPGDYTVRVIPKDPFYKGSDALEIPVSVKFLEDTVSAPIGLYGTDVYDFSLNMATVWTRCASEVPVWAIVENKSYVPANIALNIGLDPRVTLVSSTVPQDSTGADGKKYFRLANMQPFESRVVELTVSVPAASTDSIFYSSSIQHKGKVVATNDIRNLIRCSYDPNEVQVIPGGLTENGYVPMGQELTYLVRFQNTGNDTAFLVDILDTLAPSLDPLSFEMLASSHEVRYFIERNGALRFLFKDINLEDSTSNEPASHGFVLFKVKPRATVTTGTRAELTAHIYFDSNPAVKTNVAVSTFTDQYIKVAQSIDLTEGWNLVSFYVQPGDNPIENALSSCIADIEAVKTSDAFYAAGQPEWLNSLKTINGGQAYLIKAKRDTELTVNGLLVFQPFEHKLNKGWNMVGCPVKTDVAVDPMLKNKPVTEAKDFEGFWLPTAPAGNMINFEPGKGYFIFSEQPAVLPW